MIFARFQQAISAYLFQKRVQSVEKFSMKNIVVENRIFPEKKF
jgi:hypothetical protein